MASRDLPLSAGQIGIWTDCSVLPESTAYNVGACFRVRGALDVEAFVAALRHLFQRHSVLRATFHTHEGRPVQREDGEIPGVTIVDATSLDEKALHARLSEDYLRTYDLTKSSLRVCLYKTSANDHLLMLGVHHMVWDLASLDTFLAELGPTYDAIRKGESPALPPLEVTFQDFVREEAAILNDARGDALRAFWKERLSGAPTLLEIPTDRPRPAVRRGRGNNVTFPVGEALSKAVSKFGPKIHLPLLTAFLTTLHKWTRQDDMVVAMPANLRGQRFAPVVGDFINTLPLRVQINAATRFDELVATVGKTLADAVAHRDLPLYHILEGLKLPWSPGHSPLTQAVFFPTFPAATRRNPGLATSMMMGTPTKLKISDLDFDGVPVAVYPHVDVGLRLGDVNGALFGEFRFDADLWDAETMQRMAEHFVSVLSQVTEKADLAVRDIQLLTAKERDLVTSTWNATTKPFPQERGLNELLAEAAAKNPDAPAVTFESRTLSYRELRRAVGHLATDLESLGVGRNTLVPVCMDRSLEMIVTVNAILDAGGAYVPLETDWPDDRIAFMLKEVDGPVLLTHPALKARLEKLGAKAVRDVQVDELLARTADVSGRKPVKVSPDDAAYALYTSGTTGRPKCAINVQRGVVNYLSWMLDDYPLTAKDVVFFRAPYVFDQSVQDIFYPLVAGARLVVAPPGAHRDPLLLADIMEREGVSAVQLVPSMLNSLLDNANLERCSRLKVVFVGGEALPHATVKKFFEKMPGRELVNLYGPSETSTSSTHMRMKAPPDRLIVPIGRPVSNMRAFVLDEDKKPVPIGIPGEIYLAGAGLGRGYLNAAELTATKFTTIETAPGKSERAYRTGDIGRYLPDSNLEFLSRIDDQVKIRGVRMELEEVKAVLLEHPNVKTAAVVADKARSGEKVLAAYVVLKDGTKPSRGDIRAWLKLKLPEVMVPSAVVVLDALPLSGNGKLDKNALPKIEIDGSDDRPFAPPITATETTLAKIWVDVLKVERVGATDDFLELGGNSFLAVVAVKRSEKALGIKIQPSLLLKLSELRTLATEIDAMKRARAST